MLELIPVAFQMCAQVKVPVLFRLNEYFKVGLFSCLSLSNQDSFRYDFSCPRLTAHEVNGGLREAVSLNMLLVSKLDLGTWLDRLKENCTKEYFGQATE